ncbi:hypothetical protein PPYR_08696 [Photinus pyralis]|uniref:Uncharacterized protein n=1 Tax=Photinus pyralis TaxID=7054 RepID=A0A5N4AK96_PHOPY|nr:uncharacterized protein LOC116172817 [Photinus pyralis]KAB0797703.1 hypothetical protein PPYR_08696 [Photinus pyralis]
MPMRSELSLSVAMALSGLSRNECEPLGYLFDEGAKIVNAASSSSSSSSSSSRTSPSLASSESGIASFSTEYFTPPSDDGFSLFQLDEFLETLDDHQEDKKTEVPIPVNTSQVMWTGRNILNLYANIQGNATMYAQATIPKGVSSYFNNRSQLSRLEGATVPPHTVHSCCNGSCEFVEYVFT